MHELHAPKVGVLTSVAGVVAEAVSRGVVLFSVNGCDGNNVTELLIKGEIQKVALVIKLTLFVGLKKKACIFNSTVNR
jgi:hypothetical protein